MFIIYNKHYIKKGIVVIVFFICMLMPASISILVDRKINGKENNISDLILKYLFYTFLIITIMNSVIFLISSDKMLYYGEYTFTYDFCIKYMWPTLLLSIALPYILKVITSNIGIDLEIRKKKKNEKKKSSKKSSKNTKNK